MQGMHESLSVVSDSLWPHGILQARILEWGCHALLQEIFPIQDRTQVSHIAERFFTVWVTREAVMQGNMLEI